MFQIQRLSLSPWNVLFHFSWRTKRSFDFQSQTSGQSTSSAQFYTLHGSTYWVDLIFLIANSGVFAPLLYFNLAPGPMRPDLFCNASISMIKSLRWKYLLHSFVNFLLKLVHSNIFFPKLSVWQGGAASRKQTPAPMMSLGLGEASHGCHIFPCA